LGRLSDVIVNNSVYYLNNENVDSLEKNTAESKQPSHPKLSRKETPDFSSRMWLANYPSQNIASPTLSTTSAPSGDFTNQFLCWFKYFRLILFGWIKLIVYILVNDIYDPLVLAYLVWDTIYIVQRQSPYNSDITSNQFTNRIPTGLIILSVCGGNRGRSRKSCFFVQLIWVFRSKNDYKKL
jgi:hypothetical protein